MNGYEIFDAPEESVNTICRKGCLHAIIQHMNKIAPDITNRVSELVCRRTVDALEKHAFTAVYCASAAEAVDYLVKSAAQAKTIGFGGSLSIGDLDINDQLAASGAEFLIHGNPALSPEERTFIMRRQQTCDLFLCGVNAVTTSGEIVNIDGVGNRVSASIFGPSKIIMIAGRNKIVDGDVTDAIRRVKAYASPANAVRLNKNTPCAKTGSCSNCDSPDRICRVTVILDRKPSRSDITVLVVNEDMGF